ncbi:MAG: winged helix-turn-helix domain-containing protein [Planctomycetia bacterium]|nr:winged helix-turn-helix domain-containing protein [Planctomycetia bacterium]
MAIYPDGTVFEASLHSGFPAKPEKLVSPKNDTPLPLGAKSVKPSKAKNGRPIKAVKHAAKSADKSKAQLKAKPTQTVRAKDPHKCSGLDAAVKVLAEAGKSMTCRQITDKMLSSGLWTTKGHTPHATIYAAMLREIDGKPGKSRFVKTGRGLFGLAERNK